MSAIDTMNHAHVANFFGIPMYWFLEEKKMSTITHSAVDDDFKINQFSMSIGGGSGEHPALILNNDALVLAFIKTLEDTPNEKFNFIDYQIYKLVDEIQENYMKKAIYNWSLNQNQWPLESFIHIDKEMNKMLISQASLQKRMQEALALFILYKMPLDDCIEDPKLIEVAKLIRSNSFNAIMEPYTVMDKFIGFEDPFPEGGRIIRNNKAIWGYSLEDWTIENNSRKCFEQLSDELPAKSNNPKIKI